MTSWQQSAISIESVGDLERAVADVQGLLRVPAFWRGHARADWRLDPLIFRSPPAYREADLLAKFRLQGTPRTERAPRFEDNVGWIHLAQHYGLPTRLLDWTYSPMFALFFAVCAVCDEDDDYDGCVWCLDPHRLNVHFKSGDSILVPFDKRVIPLVDAAFDNKEPSNNPQVLAISAGEIDLRMLVQQAAFTIHRDNKANLVDLETRELLLCKFIVPRKAKHPLRHVLMSLGVSVGRLFPDLGHLADELRERSYLFSDHRADPQP